MWDLMVASPTVSSAAISALDKPRATAFSTCRSRPVRRFEKRLRVEGWLAAQVIVDEASGEPVVEKDVAFGDGADGGDQRSPGVSLRMKALAPACNAAITCSSTS